MVIVICAIITYQDFKWRAVIWVLFPILASLLSYLNFIHQGTQFFGVSSLTNLILVTIILGILYLYTRLILKKPFYNISLGLGDILLFYVLALSFPTVTFIVIFTSSTIFALLFFLVINRKKNHTTVPLAGLMSLYLIGVFFFDIILSPYQLYQI